MAFPATPLVVLVELALGADLTADPGTWSWTDVTSKIYARESITISRGRADQSSIADTSKLSLVADNRDGRWSTRNPSGAWYGSLRKGTPIRVSASGHVRYTGFISELPPRWDVSGKDRYAPVTAQGLLYRLTQGATPASSALRRTILGRNATAPIAYWPLEDGAGALQAASGLVGGRPMTFFGTEIFPADGFVPAGALSGIAVTPTTGVLVGSAPSAATGQFVFDFWMSCDPSIGGPAGYTQGQVSTNITGPNSGQLHVYAQNGAGGSDAMAVSLYDELGAFGTLSVLGVDVLDGLPHNIRVTLIQNGADVDVDLRVDDTSRLSGTLTTMTVPRLNTPRLPLAAVYVQSSGAPGISDGLPVTYSHVVIYDEASAASLYDAGLAYPGEEAADRFLRLGAEEGIPVTCNATQSQAMGVQGVKTFLELIRECEASDQGYLYEGLDFGLTLQGSSERNNMAVGVALTYTTNGHVAPPLEPTDDDRDVRNDVEVKRDGGSSSRITEEDVAVELSIPNSGRRDVSVTLSLGTDGQTIDLAGWLLRLGTFPGYRFPTLTYNLAAGPSLISGVTAANIAYRLTVASPPTDIGPDTVDLIVEGYTETLNLYDWDIQNNCSLNGPWRVGELATTSGDTNPDLGWLDWDSCELPAAVNSSVTTWTVTAFPTDTTTADDFPRDVYCEGELVTCTASATAVADGFGRSASNGWGTADTGQSWATSGGSASDFSVSGGDGIQLHSAVNTIKGNVIVVGSRDQRVTVHAINPFGSATGAPITQWVCPRWTDSSNYYAAVMSLNAGLIQLQLFKRVAGVLTGFYSAVTLAEGHVANDEWIIDMQVLGSDLAVKAWLTTRPEPLAWQITATDTSLSTGTSLGLLTRFETGNTNSLPQSLRWDDLDVVSARTWTVTRNVNDLFGGGKAHAANAAITLAHPLVASL